MVSCDRLVMTKRSNSGIWKRRATEWKRNQSILFLARYGWIYFASYEEREDCVNMVVVRTYSHRLLICTDSLETIQQKYNEAVWDAALSARFSLK